MADEKTTKQVNMVAFLLSFYVDDMSKKELLISNYIKKSIKHELTSSDMVESSSSRVVFIKKQMVALSSDFLKKLHIKNGHRVHFPRGHHLEVFKDNKEKETMALKYPFMVSIDKKE